jgi:outer membrane usher protein
MAAAAPAPDTAMDASSMSVIADRSDAGPSAPAKGGQDLYLEVVLNGSATRRVAHFTRDGAHLRVSADSLRQLGFRLPAQEQGSIDLGSLSGVSFHYDEETQRVEITTSPALVDQATAHLNVRENNVPKPQASPGLLLNYDLYATHDSSGNFGLSAYSELRAFNTWGVLSSTAVTRATDSPGSGWTDDTIRLDTTFTRSFVDDTTTLRIGDAISSSLTWTRATRFGGIQLERDFSLQPDLITFPVPAFYGQAALPSTVDLYVDGLKQYSSQVPAGPFQLNTVPVVNGSGEAQVVVTDALGRQSTLAFPFYTTSQLLRQGLSDYSLEAGFVRQNYGITSFSYDHDLATSGSYRYGVTDWLTVEGHAETSAGVTDAGAGSVIGLGDAGVVNAAAAASSEHGATGALAELGYNWRNEHFNFSLDRTRSFGTYRDVASLDGLPPARRSDRALAGVTLGALGSLGVSYVNLQYPGQAGSRYASAFYFHAIGSRASFNLSFNQDLDNHSDRSVFLGVSLSLRNNTSVSLSAQHDQQGNVATLDASQPINPDGGFGWRARVQDGANQSGGLAEAGYRGEQGQVLTGAQSLNGSSQVYTDFSGALVWMDGQLFAARQIQDAFAVVSTDGVANVPVMLENRPIGVTNANGDLLVTPLNAYQRNKLAIDPMQLPADVHIDRVDAEVVPSDRAGTLVRFGIQPIAAASIVLHDAGGKPLQIGSMVQLRGKPGSNNVIGYDGIVYLEGLGAHNTLIVQTPTGGCQVQFDYHTEKQTVPVIGPLTCHAGKP